MDNPTSPRSSARRHDPVWHRSPTPELREGRQIVRQPHRESKRSGTFSTDVEALLHETALRALGAGSWLARARRRRRWRSSCIVVDRVTCRVPRSASVRMFGSRSSSAHRPSSASAARIAATSASSAATRSSSGSRASTGARVAYTRRRSPRRAAARSAPPSGPTSVEASTSSRPLSARASPPPRPAPRTGADARCAASAHPASAGPATSARRGRRPRRRRARASPARAGGT